MTNAKIDKSRKDKFTWTEDDIVIIKPEKKKSLDELWQEFLKRIKHDQKPER